ncbi:PaaI family thioesterase [Rhodococcus qingshengii]|uniref:PaaI family thioesterase n=1 Tax=Rhodococcus qingshengii TaxID=334542 RepID=UPI001455FBE4|nr:PaaI family thioesterase [Rhodococcus qingshengii]
MNQPPLSDSEPQHQLAPAGGSEQDWINWANSFACMGPLGLQCRSVTPEGTEFVMSDIDFPLNPNGALHGGIVTAAADQVMGIVAARASAADYVPVTGSLHVQFHSPAMLPLTIRGFLLPSGFRTKFVEVVVEDETGRRCATAHATMLSARATHRFGQ